MKRPSKITIKRTLSGKASEEDTTQTVRWFAEDESVEYLSQIMDEELYLQEEILSEEVLDHEIPSEEMFRSIKKKVKKRKISRVLLYAASIVLPLFLLGLAVFELDTRMDLFSVTEYKEIHVPKGDRIQFVFQDGSTAHLNSNSTLKYPTKFGVSERRVQLEGEAYFVVEKNTRRPFIVETDSASIHVLGTSFNVEAYPNKNTVNVTLDEGKVNLVASAGDKKYALEAGEELTYDKFSKVCIITSTSNHNFASIWKTGGLAFKNHSVSEVISVLNKKYNVEFIIEDVTTLKYSYSVVIPDNNAPLSKVIADLERIAPVRYIIENDTIRVRMK